ncbi:hypothetical protein [Luteipulveratus halotolerans]|nr:hypothetical protein [Luteipulveratus halotolerans]
MSMLMVVICGTLQLALYAHATNVASGAADQALQEARTINGTAGSGQARGREFLAKAGPRSLTDASVQVNRGTEQVTVVVRGRFPSLVPGFTFPAVEAHSQGATERITR